jgi:prepilin-type N-terminal cleavage/methylation domain-containing protein
MIKINKKAFTLVEMVVVIAVIGILTTIAVVAVQNSRRGVRDAKRVADIKQIQTALKLYYNNVGSYPELASITASNSIQYNGIVYMSDFPQAPTPADGDCNSSNNEYAYLPIGTNNLSYQISFCLGGQIASLSQGEKCAVPNGIMTTACSEYQIPAGFNKFYDFNYNSGYQPDGSLTIYNETFYGVTDSGGTNTYGTVFKINSDGTDFTKLYDFYIDDGANPRGDLVVYNDFLYGMTTNSGESYYGTIFKISPDGTDFTKLYDFDGGNGGYPRGSLTIYNDVLYGITYSGGANNYGTIFKINPDGTGFTKLHDFDGTNGSYSRGSLTIYNDVLYGITAYGGSNDAGIIFKINPDGTGFTKLHDFDIDNDGAWSFGDLIVYNSVLYGMAQSGGVDSGGTIFKINPDGSNFTVIHNFNYSNGINGYWPFDYLAVNDDTFYGMTNRGGSYNAGTIFKINSDGTGFTKLYDLNDSNGTYPHGSLVFYNNVLYGMTGVGGTNNSGTIFGFGL